MIFLSAGAFAHGVGFKRSELQAIPLEFSYSTGEKMSYSEVKIYSPKDSKFAVQTGRTDEEGRFAFIPDVSGDWRVTVSDGQGHLCEAVINANAVEVEVKPSDSSLVIPALLGVSIIFNIALFIVNRRKSNAH